jgi:hypothetical protein
MNDEPRKGRRVNNTALSGDDRARTFFDRFVTAFATFDPMRIADLFATPGVTLRADGSLVPLITQDDVIDYYRAAIEGYHRNGCRSCRWADLTVTTTGARSLLAAVTWDLLHEDGSTMAAWRQSYYLTECEDGLKAFASATHAD